MAQLTYASYGRFYEYIPLDLADRALSSETQATYTTNPSSCTDPKDPPPIKWWPSVTLHLFS